MILSSEDLKLLEFNSNNVVVKKVKLSTGEFYAKYCNIYETFMELLGNKVFALIGIKCPTYHYIKEAYCVISDDVRKYDTYYHPFDLNMNGYTLRNVKCKLCDSGLFSNIDEINFQIDVMHFIDILFGNIDRHISNFRFARREDGTGYLVVYDNAEFLTQFDKATRPMSIDGADSLSFVFTDKEVEAREFISKLSEEEILYLLKIYEMFSPIRLVTIIRSIEKENNIKLPDKLDVFKKYLKNYLMVGKLLKERGKIHKK